MSSDKNVPVLTGSRAVGILAGGKVYIPLPTDAEEAEALRGNLNSQYRAVLAVDRIHALAVALNAPRHILHDPVAERAALEEERAQIRHERELAQEQREADLYEARLKKLQAKHRHDAESEFKDEKFGLGKARFAQRKAEAEVGEAVAREGMRGEVFPPEPEPAKTKTSEPSLAQHYARLVDDLDERIAKAEAAGESTEEMRGEQDLLNKMLRRELLKGG
jgi:hypothetical protein